MPINRMKINDLRRIFLLLLFIFTLCGFDSTLFSQCNHKNVSFQAGEKLTYHVYYHFGLIKIKLADVKLWTEEGNYNNKPVTIIKNTTNTLKDFEWIIKVKDYYASYLDKNTMKVERHIQKTLVDDYSTDYEYRFNYEFHKIYATIENSKTRKYIDTLNLMPCLHDLLSAVYYPRNMDFTKQKPGDKTVLPVILDTSTYNIYFRYIGLETINTTNKKKVSCIKIVPFLVETSIFKSGEKMTAWFSNDKNRVPLRMESDLWIGKILVELVKYEGLLYPINY
jgi:hypothetical protein